MEWGTALKTAINNKIIELTAKIAIGIEIDDVDIRIAVGSLRLPAMRSAIHRAARKLVIDREGILRCGICNKGPFTRKGLYLHLTRIHRYDIAKRVEEEYVEFSNLIENKSP